VLGVVKERGENKWTRIEEGKAFGGDFLDCRNFAALVAKIYAECREPEGFMRKARKQERICPLNLIQSLIRIGRPKSHSECDEV